MSARLAAENLQRLSTRLMLHGGEITGDDYDVMERAARAIYRLDEIVARAGEASDSLRSLVEALDALDEKSAGEDDRGDGTD